MRIVTQWNYSTVRGLAKPRRIALCRIYICLYYLGSSFIWSLKPTCFYCHKTSHPPQHPQPYLCVCFISISLCLNNYILRIWTITNTHPLLHNLFSPNHTIRHPPFFSYLLSSNLLSSPTLPVSVGTTVLVQ